MVDIVYEDNHVLVCLKPQNMPTQEDSSKDQDLLNMLKNYIKEKYNKPGNVYLGLVHRLDRPTGGLMVFAKTSKCASRLSEQMRNGNFSKKYYACLVGQPRYKKHRLEHYLLKDEKTNTVTIVPQTVSGAKLAVLEYEILDVYEKQISLASIKIDTGRSHQIRVQMSSLGTPVFGDAKYNGNIIKGQNLALWAYELSFAHPVTNKKLVFHALPRVDVAPWRYFTSEFEKRSYTSFTG